MLNPYQSEPAKIIKITPQTDNIKLFLFDFKRKVWGYNFSHQPGQIIELSIPGFGEAPFAPCNAPGTKYLELCVRDIGRLTHKLHSMKIGDEVGIRGPFGQGWPIDSHCEKQSHAAEKHNDFNEFIPLSVESLFSPPARQKQLRLTRDNIRKNLLIVVGGLGLIPLRTLILGKNKFLGKDAKIQIFYGARHPNEMLFRYEYNRWRQNGVKVNLTVDKECPDWVGCVGLVPILFDKHEIVTNARAFLCGPPVMYKFVLEKLKERGFADQDIYLSLERRMQCGIGVCQHCAVGPYYTCKDGPVFRYDLIKEIPGVI